MVMHPGTRLRDYEIIGLIGTGGTGEVYKAHELNLNRDVAIKVYFHCNVSFSLQSPRIALRSYYGLITD